MKIGNRVKCSTSDKAIQDRLRYNPEIVEFYLTEKDLQYNELKRLQELIQYLKSKNIRVYLHHPSKVNGKYLDILSEDKEVKDYFMESSRILTELYDSENVKSVVHSHYKDSESSFDVSIKKTVRMKKEIEKVLAFGREALLWENSIEGIFTYSNPYLLEYLINPLQLPLIHDVSHTFISLSGDNEKLLKIAKEIDSLVQYLHVVDSKGEEHDGLELGTGKIDWKSLKPYIQHKDFIFEILLEDQDDCLPMIKSAEYFNAL